MFERLRTAHVAAGTPERFEALCRRLIDAQPQDWRARLALAAHLRTRGDARGAFDLLIDALAHNPHAVSIHQAIWETLVELASAAPTSTATWRSAARPSSTAIRTSASAAATAATSCCGSARTATSGTRSSRSARRRPRTASARRASGPMAVAPRRVDRWHRHGQELRAHAAGGARHPDARRRRRWRARRVAPGTPGLAAVASASAPASSCPTAALDRRALGVVVFGDPQARADLEAIIHPQVREATGDWLDRLAAAGESLAVVDIPLLYETGRDRDFDRVIVTCCPRVQQLARIVERDGLTAAQAEARIAAQMPTDDKVQRADFVIDTGGTFGDTNRQIDRVVERLLELAAAAER